MEPNGYRSTLPPPPRKGRPDNNVAAASDEKNSGDAHPPKILVVLGIDSAQVAHEHAEAITHQLLSEGLSVAIVQSDPDRQDIRVNKAADHEFAGSVIRIRIPDIARIELVDIATKLTEVIDRVVVSGPGSALSQLSLEYATVADTAVIVGGRQSQARHLSTILDQLDVTHHIERSEDLEPQGRARPRRLLPPGHLH